MYAYFTMSSDEFTPGVMCLVHTLRQHTEFPIYCMDLGLSSGNIEKIEKQGAKCIAVEQITSELARPQSWRTVADFHQKCFRKLNMWDRTEFEKIVYLDADMVILKPIDELFYLKADFAACRSTRSVLDAATLKQLKVYLDEDFFNAGMLVLKPDHLVFQDLMKQKDRLVCDEDPSDQGFLNVYYKNLWYKLPNTYNATRRLYEAYRSKWNEIEADIKVIHYPLTNPWDKPSEKRDALDEIWWKHSPKEVGKKLHRVLLPVKRRQGG